VLEMVMEEALELEKVSARPQVLELGTLQVLALEEVGQQEAGVLHPFVVLQMEGRGR